MKSKAEFNSIQIFILISVFQISTIAKESSEQKYKDGLRFCSEAGFVDECAMLYQELDYEDRFSEKVFKLQEMACDFSPASCSSALITAEMKFLNKVEVVFQKLVSQCNRNPDFCGDLARVYNQRRMPALALEAYRKDFEKTGNIGYAVELREQKKDSKLIEKVVEQACDRDAESCVSAVKGFRNHPKHKKFVEKIEILCEESTPESNGLNECLEVGGIYYKKQNFEKAFKFWLKSCDSMEHACLIILGSDKATPGQLKSAYENFCFSKNRIGTYHSLNILRKKHCRKNFASFPKEIIEESRSQFVSFINYFYSDEIL